MNLPKKHSHYFKDVSNLRTIDVYRVLQLFNVTDPCLQHAVKKLLVAGGRGHKDIEKDIQESIDTLVRWQVMRKEDDAVCLVHTMAGPVAQTVREFTESLAGSYGGTPPKP